jgi:Flp pilus assembly protein TadG
MIRRFIRTIRNAQRGSTIIEFAFAAPILFLMLMAAFDLNYRAFIYSTLQGAVQKAARDGTLENGSGATSSLDARIRLQVAPIVDNGTFTFTRKNYESFTRAGQAENFTDANSNGVRDAGECFQDENGNASWDSDTGLSGQGGARDIVVYTATVVYPRIFPLYGMLGWNPNQTVSATTVLRNQPYATQQRAAPVAVCT